MSGSLFKHTPSISIGGHAVYAYTAGQPYQSKQSTLIFIHGAQNDHSVWSLQARYFAYHGYNVFAVDLPGHGRSQGSALPTIEALSEWITTFIATLSIEKATLIGHSMGSLIALDTARRAPHVVNALALLGTAYPMKVSESLLDIARHDEKEAIRLVNDFSHTRRTQISSPPGSYLQGQAKQLMRRLSILNPAQLFYTDFTACNQYQLGDQALEKVNEQSIPTLLILGEEDRMTPRKASQALRTALPHAQCVTLPKCGHAMMTEQPDAVLKALIRLLAKPTSFQF